LTAQKWLADCYPLMELNLLAYYSVEDKVGLRKTVCSLGLYTDQ